MTKTKREMREAAIKRLNEMYETGPYTTQDIVVALAGSSGWVGRIIDLLTDDEPQYEGNAYAMGPRDAGGIIWFRGDMSDSEWGVIERTYFDGERWMVCGHDLTAPWVPADSIRHAPMRTATQREDDLIELIKDASRDYVRIQTYYKGLLREYNRFCEDNYMLLPVDANGVPIHIGDRVVEHEDGHTFKVDGYEYAQAGPSGKKWWVFHTDGICAIADDCTHYKPTIEDVLDELEGMRGSGSDYEAVVMRCADLADTLRKLLLKKED